MDLHERSVPTFSEVSGFLPSSGMVFGRDYPSLWAISIGTHSGVLFTKQEQLDLYRELSLRDRNPDSIQVIYARVLARTGGPVDIFRAKYPNISFPSGLELESF